MVLPDVAPVAYFLTITASKRLERAVGNLSKKAIFQWVNRMVWKWHALCYGKGNTRFTKG